MNPPYQDINECSTDTYVFERVHQISCAVHGVEEVFVEPHLHLSLSHLQSTNSFEDKLNASASSNGPVKRHQDLLDACLHSVPVKRTLERYCSIVQLYNWKVACIIKLHRS